MMKTWFNICLLVGISAAADLHIAHHSPLIAKEAVGLGYAADTPGVAVAAAHVDDYAPELPVATKTQYHAQDELGQYAYGYSEPNQIKEERKFYDGTVIGSYSYNSPDGRVVTNNYVADDHGFRSNLAPTLHKDNQVAVAQEAAKVAAASAAYRAPIYADGYAAPGYYNAPAATAVVAKSYPHASGYVAEPTYTQEYIAPAPIAKEYVHAAPIAKEYVAPIAHAAPLPAAPLVKEYVPAAPVVKEYVAHQGPAHVEAEYVQSHHAKVISTKKAYSAGPAAVAHKTYIEEHPAPAPVSHVAKSYAVHGAPVVHKKEYVHAAPVVHKKEYVHAGPVHAAPVEYAAPVHAVHKEYAAPVHASPAPAVYKKEYYEPPVVAKKAYVDHHHGIVKEASYVAKPGVTLRKTVVDEPPRTVSIKKHYHADPYSSGVHVERQVVDPAPRVHVEKTYHNPGSVHKKAYLSPYGGAVEKTYVEPPTAVKKHYVSQGPAQRHVTVDSHQQQYGPAIHAARKFRSYGHGGYRSHGYARPHGGRYIRNYRHY